jgi:hypothetical protein
MCVYSLIATSAVTPGYNVVKHAETQLAYSLTLEMEATCTSETEVDFQLATRRYITEDRTLHNHGCENLRSYTVLLYVEAILSGTLHGSRSSLTLLATCFTLVSCLAYSSTLKTIAICSAETAVDFQRTTLRYIPEDRSLQEKNCNNMEKGS